MGQQDLAAGGGVEKQRHIRDIAQAIGPRTESGENKLLDVKLRVTPARGGRRPITEQ